MPPDRFRVAAALPPDGGWRAELALDRQATPPRPVALARVPPAVSGDAAALAALARGVDLASRLSHPSLLPVHGLVEVDGGLAVVGAFREGETLRAVLDGGGPLTPALASRVVGDVARAVQAIHGLAAAGARALAHGALRPERVLVGEDGAVLLTGLGRPAVPPATPADDLAALPRLLAECLAPGGAGPLPPELAPLTVEVAGAEGPRPAGAFADALAAAVSPAAPGALAARVDSAIPKGAAARAQRRRALAQALLAEAGGEGEHPAAAAPTSGGQPAAPPALSPPPFRSPLAPSAAPRAPGPEPATAPPPQAADAAAPAPLAEPGRAAAPPRTAPPRSAPPRAAPPAAAAPVPATPLLPASLLDDPRLPRYAAAVLGLLGLLAGILLGRG